MEAAATTLDRERRKQVKVNLRNDLVITPQKYEGRTYYIVKDPVSLRYYRFKEQEHFLLKLMDGTHTLDEAQKEFEENFRPERLTLEDLEGFAQQLVKVGLAQNDSPQAGKHLFENRKKRQRRERLAYFTNILYIKIPIFDPDWLLERMLPWFRWLFTTWFFTVSTLFMASALFLVLSHFETFRSKLPSFHEFFSFKSVIYLWIALGVVKVIHEFGHGLSCKAFGGEVHEMGALFLCLSPCLYCNVSDAWNMPNKWHRIIIGFAGIYVELMIAAAATFIWWNTPSHPFVNNLSLSLMIVCSVSTVVFNGNPLMRFDGYYVLADWLEIPNLRERANRFLKQVATEYCLGIEVQQREPYMELGRQVLFISYAIVSYIYRWVVTFSILYFLYVWLKPYKLGTISAMLALMALGTMVGWPLYNLGSSIHKRGRLPDMKSERVWATIGVVMAVLFMICFVPLPVSRIRESALVQFQPGEVEPLYVKNKGGILERMDVRNGQTVAPGEVLARFSSPDLENDLAEARAKVEIGDQQIQTLDSLRKNLADPRERSRLDAEITRLRTERDINAERLPTLMQMQKDLVIKAPRAGVVYGLPPLDEIGKTWDPDQERAFCSIADPQALRVLVPLRPDDYHMLEENIAELGGKEKLAATIRVQGRGGQTWSGRISQLPESIAKDVPPALTAKYGGPLAVKPSAHQGQVELQAQHFLVGIDIVNPDAAICAGTAAQVKIHCQWRTARWWIWHTISKTFDLGLW